MNILEIKDLVKTYETGLRALDGLHLSVPAGTLFGFLGLNGAGKTTTIRILAGLNSRDSGSVELFGERIDPAECRHRQRIGFVLDEPLYFEWMTVAEYLEFVGIMEGLSGIVTEARLHELITFFDLTEKEDDLIGTLSTGMKKKISLAAAIIHNPDLLVLDEPFEGIDAVAASSIKEALTLMVARGGTVIITSHALDTIEKLCSVVGIIHRGKLLLQSETARLRETAATRLNDETLHSLEEIFVGLLGDASQKKALTFLTHGNAPQDHPAAP